MPISKSAKKSLRVALRKTALNRHRKTLIKAALKNVTADTFSKAISMIDKGVKWNLFHQNKAARMKSALAKQLPKGAKIAPKPTVVKSEARSTKSETKSKSLAKAKARKVALKSKTASKK